MVMFVIAGQYFNHDLIVLLNADISVVLWINLNTSMQAFFHLNRFKTCGKLWQNQTNKKSSLWRTISEQYVLGAHHLCFAKDLNLARPGLNAILSSTFLLFRSYLMQKAVPTVTWSSVFLSLHDATHLNLIFWWKNNKRCDIHSSFLQIDSWCI